MSFSQYTEFFRQIAVNHKEIHHVEGDKFKKFYRVVVSEHPLGHHYFLDELIQGARTQLKMPCLVLELYNFEDDNKQMADNIRRTRNAAFIILDQVDKNRHDSVEETLDKCDRISQEIMAYVLWYYRTYPQQGRIELNSVDGEPVGPWGDNLFGMRRNFQITNPVNMPYVFDSNKFDQTLQT